MRVQIMNETEIVIETKRKQIKELQREIRSLKDNLNYIINNKLVKKTCIGVKVLTYTNMNEYIDSKLGEIINSYTKNSYKICLYDWNDDVPYPGETSLFMAKNFAIEIISDKYKPMDRIFFQIKGKGRKIEGKIIGVFQPMIKLKNDIGQEESHFVYIQGKTIHKRYCILDKNIVTKIL